MPFDPESIDQALNGRYAAALLGISEVTSPKDTFARILKMRLSAICPPHPLHRYNPMLTRVLTTSAKRYKLDPV